jgi:hypothetical protein
MTFVLADSCAIVMAQVTVASAALAYRQIPAQLREDTMNILKAAFTREALRRVLR